jgi:biotin transport system substrate-specific component
MNQENPLSLPDIRKLIALPLFAAMIAAGSYIVIPVGVIPVVMQNFFVLLSGLVLGPAAGGASVCLFLLMGIVGLPVFAGGTGGIARFAAPSAGFLVSYPVAAWLAGLLSGFLRKGRAKAYTKELCAVLAAEVLVFAIGLVWLKIRLGLDWAKTFGTGFVPFIPGDILKCLAAPALAPILRAIFRNEGIGAEK